MGVLRKKVLYCGQILLDSKITKEMVLEKVFKSKPEIENLYKDLFNENYLNPDNRYKSGTIKNETDLVKAYVNNSKIVNKPACLMQKRTFYGLYSKYQEIFDKVNINYDYPNNCTYWELYTIINIFKYGEK